jgi:LemA protein
MMMWLILGGVVALLIVYVVATYNTLVHLRALVDEAWSGIDVQLKRRYDLIPNLVATVKQYSIHEKTTLEDVIKMRAAAMGATNIAAKALAESELTHALKNLFVVVEQYPNLKANEQYISLQKELSALEHELQLARRYYNGAARNYRIRVSSFPSNLVAKNTGFETVPYFELTSADERNAPRVNF